MNADESQGIEMAGQFVQRGAVEHLFTGDVQIYIDSRALDPVDVGHPNEASGSAALDYKAIEIAAGLGSRSQDVQDAAAEFAQVALLMASLDAGKRSFPAFIAERLQQIIE